MRNAGYFQGGYGLQIVAHISWREPGEGRVWFGTPRLPFTRRYGGAVVGVRGLTGKCDRSAFTGLKAVKSARSSSRLAIKPLS